MLLLMYLYGLGSLLNDHFKVHQLSMKILNLGRENVIIGAGNVRMSVFGRILVVERFLLKLAQSSVMLIKLRLKLIKVFIQMFFKGIYL